MNYENPLPKVLKHPLRFISILRMVLLWLRKYFVTQSQTDAATARIVETAADDRVEADEGQIYPYLFAAVYVLFVAWFVFDRLSRKEYKRAYNAYHGMILAAEEIFSKHPTRMRSRIQSDHPLIHMTHWVDGPTNCYPSLHVALVVLSYQFVKDSPGADELMRKAMRRSCVDICRSTMKTKQHCMIDVIGGVELSRRAYQKHFEGEFEDLTSEILLELTEDELSEIRGTTENDHDMPAMLEVLLARISCWA